MTQSLERDYPKAATRLRDDSERMLAFYAFPEPHWRHLRTTNIRVEFRCRTRSYRCLQAVALRHICYIPGVRNAAPAQLALAQV